MDMPQAVGLVEKKPALENLLGGLELEGTESGKARQNDKYSRTQVKAQRSVERCIPSSQVAEATNKKFQSHG